MYKIFGVSLIIAGAVVGANAALQGEDKKLGAFGDPFLSVQLATSPTNGYILSTDGTDNSWIANTSGATVFGGLSDVATSSDGTGDVYYLNSSGQITNLGAGSDGEVLKLSSGIPSWGTDNTGAASDAFEIATTSSLSVSELSYFTKTGGRTTIGGVATGTVSAGTGISLDSAVRSVVGGALQITNSSPLSGLTANYPFSFSNPTLTWLGFSTTTDSGVAAGLAYIGSGGLFQTVATSSPVDLDISGNAGTATALAANGSNCSAGNAPLGVDASGASEGCFDVWTEAENTSAAYIALTDLSATWPIDYNNGTGAFTWGGLATSSGITTSQALYATGVNTFEGVATTAPSAGTGISFSATPGALLGGNAFSISSTLGTDIDLTAEVTGTLPVANGGTGATTFTNNRLLTGNGTSALVDEANLTFDGSIFTVTGQVNLDGTGGVILNTDGDGALTITGNSAGNDEDLVFNFDDVANEVGITSTTGVTLVDFNTIGIDTDSLTVGADTITSLDGDATLNIVSNNLRVVDVTCTGCLGTTEIAGLDISDDTNLAAGRSLTLSGDSVEADAELYTHTATANIHATSSNQIATSTNVWLSRQFPQAATITRIDCFALDAGTSTIQAQIRTSAIASGNDILYGTGLDCGSDQEIASTTLQNIAVGAQDWITVNVPDAEPTGTRPRAVFLSITWTYDD